MKCFKDNTTINLKKCHIPLDNWEELALDRHLWRESAQEEVAARETELPRVADSN